MSELLTWCKEERGRELAAAIGVTEQVVSNWLYIYRRKTPSLRYWLAFQAFSKKIRRKRK
jgi:hypothetical protein